MQFDKGHDSDLKGSSTDMVAWRMKYSCVITSHESLIESLVEKS